MRCCRCRIVLKVRAPIDFRVHRYTVCIHYSQSLYQLSYARVQLPTHTQNSPLAFTYNHKQTTHTQASPTHNNLLHTKTTQAQYPKHSQRTNTHSSHSHPLSSFRPLSVFAVPSIFPVHLLLSISARCEAAGCFRSPLYARFGSVWGIIFERVSDFFFSIEFGLHTASLNDLRYVGTYVAGRR